MTTPTALSDLLVFSRVRWDLFYQRPQQLISRHAKVRRVFYIEEPIWGLTDISYLHTQETPEGAKVMIPYLSQQTTLESIYKTVKELITKMITDYEIKTYTLWYDNPEARNYSSHLKPIALIYDCTKESTTDSEKEILSQADLVFTNSHTLYKIKHADHNNVHPFPNCIDYSHLYQGRLQLIEPEDQGQIPHPRIGFYGVIDNRLDFELLKNLAEKNPTTQFIMIGTIAGVNPDQLPQNSNIYYLGKKDYHTLPQYLAGWDCAILPYRTETSVPSVNSAKVQEYLASGKPVVSTPIKDVIYSYGSSHLVSIAYNEQEFSEKIQWAMQEKVQDRDWIKRVDQFLSDLTWENTFTQTLNLESSLSISNK